MDRTGHYCTTASSSSRGHLRRTGSCSLSLGRPPQAALIVDNFLPSFAALRSYADTASYDSTVNPVDSIAYPGICTAPDWVSVELTEGLRKAVGRPVTPTFTFMRLSLQGSPAPHQAHTDSTMGRYSLMLYLNREEHCKGGTSLVQHKATGMRSDPWTQTEQAIWARDTNSPDAWSVYKLAVMKPNRAFIFPAKLMHRAEPIGGFGNTAVDGRLVLTCFFN